MKVTSKRPTYIDGSTAVFSCALFLLTAVAFITVQKEVQAGERGAVGDVYVCNYFRKNILQFDGTTGAFSCIFATYPSNSVGGTFYPSDLVWAPNGNLWVTVECSGAVSAWPGGNYVIEFDGQTGSLLRTVSFMPGSYPTQIINLGGFDSNLYMVPRYPYDHVPAFALVDRFNIHTGAYIEMAADPVPPMYNVALGRFTLEGGYVVLGNALQQPVPVIRLYDASKPLSPTDNSFGLIGDLLVESNAVKSDIVETPDGLSYLVTDYNRNRVEKYDKATGAFQGIAINRDPCLDIPPPSAPNCDPTHCYFRAMQNPYRLAFGPNGHLFVTGLHTANYDPVTGCYSGDQWGAVHEFDLATGQQVRVFGQQTNNASDPKTLRQPAGIAFKPLPGDFGSSGSTNRGDWLVDEKDLAMFTAALNGISPGYRLIANLQSFDFNHDGIVDCADWLPFKAAFLASSGFTPALPLPSIDDFVAALLGMSSQSCFSDRNGDGIINGADIQPFINQAFEP